ncbi:hypothetical protein J416_09039 [Gracilibacillus halophilus YIM-C55.5]|uniref:HD-GYP domain-containing protein n=1 Tax=Gracilibacillus halophilus YIM-C55.5 TaxID=1308866 RepID=N4WUN9_9BACI|nr:HD-GYP domain-containing protein [Gracilibacillus halophilus]ENH96831.1 hypothetical protein J416_09039 [Gracilibacillus halophilus YIM-C55.5]
MRLIATKYLQEGMELAKPIKNDYGRILVQRHVKLSTFIIKRLLDYGITYVYIRDQETDDIVIESPVSEDLKLDAMNHIRESFRLFDDKDLEQNPYLLSKTIDSLQGVAKQMATEISHHDEVIQYVSDLLISDHYVYQHSVNVSLYTIALAQAFQFPTHQIEEIGLGALLHDIGKVFLPQNILNKSGKLTDDEFEIIKKHTEYGFEFLRKSHELPLLIAHCAFQHHERIDGSGYPRGITGNEMHPYAKIMSVADVFDAVTTNRVYRDAMLPHEGLEILYAGADKQFESHIVDAFRRTIALYPNGLTVTLSDNRIGIVARQNHQVNDRPVIRITHHGEEKVSTYDLDLSKELDIMIVGMNDRK